MDNEVVSYTRVSTLEQTKGVSIEAQLEARALPGLEPHGRGHGLERYVVSDLILVIEA